MSFQQSVNQDEFKVKLYVNVFPTEKFDWDYIKVDVDKKVLYVRYLFEFHSSTDITPSEKFWCFKTNGIFLNCCQDEVYSTVFSDIFPQIFLGVDHTLLCYGQNYSGKSYTLSGFHNQYELRGIIPRFVVDLFKQLESKHEDYSPKVYISVVDIYKNLIYDLLSHPKRVCKESKDVKKAEVSSEVECLELLFRSEAQRIIVENKPYNAHSGTTVVTFLVKLFSLNSNEPVNKTSEINFVDLAGVETIYRNPVTSFKDQNIQGDANFTKTMLELYGLRSKKTNKSETNRLNQNIHVLTRYLSNSFSSASCIALLCHIRPSREDIKITLSTLKFGKTFQGIPVRKPDEHKEPNFDMTLQKLTQEITNLKDKLLIADLAKQQHPIQISQERIDFVKRTVQSFLNGELPENELLSLVNDPELILNVIKSVHNEPIPKASVILQTEVSQDPVDSKPSDSPPEPTKTEEKLSLVTKKVSIKEAPKGKAGKNKDGGKSKGAEKVVLQSEETQVNLIEPNAVLPSLESREGLWAMFLISRPDIHGVLEKLNANVAEKNKKLCKESTTYDSINQSVNKTQLALNQLVNFIKIESTDTSEQEGKARGSIEEEKNLVQEHRRLCCDLEQSKQRLIDAQFDWLEALEKLNNEKEIIEEEFKRFCADNNFLPLENQSVGEEEVCFRQNESITEVDSVDIEFKKVYRAFQRKYLHKITL